ncbi:HDOD domain-containing protein [Desulfoplanes formicivorans]|uniref:Metal-dependent hydrolase n=1 Tax=Desulfoplanes formicivorans TaxID=1592317 RepID=A0A194AIS2_9BACT|nr:HDOD domain-containing protein [Desulfoplanes formicivorans]GAU09228.1 metal-dependent hydrolase [Desulfoplanes formicivorans]
MHKICTEHLQPEMVLAKDVPGADNSTLFAKGRLLSDDDIVMLRDLDLGYVYIASRGKQKDHEDLLRRCDEYTYQFFMYVNPESNLFNELYRLSLSKVLAEASINWNLPCAKDLRATDVEYMRDLFFKGEGVPEDIVRHETSLVSFPDIYFKIKDLLESQDCSASELAKIVSTDIGLSAKILRLVNSSFYNFSSTIDSIDRAISLVGNREVSTLALGVSAINFFKDIPPELIDMRVFWRHSLSCAIYCKLIALVMGHSGERFFTAGLLHDAGRLIIFKNMPYGSVQTLLTARSEMLPLVEAERQVLGYDHTQVGDLLFREWQMPEFLRDIVANHHDPTNAGDPQNAAIVQLADNLANAMAIPSGSTFVLPGMQENDWKLLGLQGSQLQEICNEHDRCIEQVLKAFLTNS